MSEDQVKKRVASRKEGAERRKKLGFPVPLVAIRENCLECQGEGPNYVRDCDVTTCKLWPYRMGRVPRDCDLQVAQFDKNGKVVGYEQYEGKR
jgi:hypothetical protein